MKNRFLFGSLFALLVVALLGASNIPQGWTWNSTLNAFQVLMKGDGETKFVASAKGVRDGSTAAPGMVGEEVYAERLSSDPLNPTFSVWSDVVHYDLPAGNWEAQGWLLWLSRASSVVKFTQAGIGTESGATAPNIGPPSSGEGKYAMTVHGTSAGIAYGSNWFLTQATPRYTIRSTAVTRVYLKSRAEWTTEQISVVGFITFRRIR
jgi:hypothetical protein